MDERDIYELKVSTVTQYRQKVARALARVPKAIDLTMSRLPTETVDFPELRVVVDMWRIVKSPFARPGSMREAVGA